MYLDHAATTPMRPESIEAMSPYLAGLYANPSGSHRFSRAARQAIDEARDVVADVVGCRPGEVIFTGGGTESDNLAVRGVVEATGGIAVCSAAEHHAVLHCVEHAPGGRVVAVDAHGVVDLDALDSVLAETGESTACVSIMTVNNETGAITDLDGVARVVKRRAPRSVVHTDAVQAACWIDLRAVWPRVDLLALSAHKFGGPKGVGVLAVRTGTPLAPLLLGGGQERDRRSGTHNVAGIVAMATALASTDRERSSEVERVEALRDDLLDRLTSIDGVHRTLPADRSVPGIAHVCVADVESEALLYLLDEDGICASAASACASGAMEPSHVLAAMGVDKSLARGALRLSLGHTTSGDDVDRAARAVATAVDRLRRPRS